MRARKAVIKITQDDRKRDVEWTRALGVTDRIMTPEEGKIWLENDRIIRARNVSEARRLRGPCHW